MGIVLKPSEKRQMNINSAEQCINISFNQSNAIIDSINNTLALRIGSSGQSLAQNVDDVIDILDMHDNEFANIKDAINRTDVVVPESASVDDYPGYIDDIIISRGWWDSHIAAQKYIFTYAWYYQKNLVNFNVPDDIMTILRSQNYLYLDSAFKFDSNLETVGNLFDRVIVAAMGSTFASCTKLQSIDKTINLYYASSWSGSSTFGIGNTFSGCRNLESVSINILHADYTNTTNLIYTFSNCVALKNLDIHSTDGVKWNASGINLSYSPLLTVDSIMSVLNMLKDISATTAKTIKIGAVNMAKLTAEQIAVATDKGWTIS